MAEYVDDFQDLRDIEEWRELQEREGRRYKQRVDPFEYYSEQEFQERYRLTKDLFSDMLGRIEHQLPTSVDKRGNRISPLCQFLVALRYLATGNFQLTLGDCTDISQASVSRCVKNPFLSPSTDKERRYNAAHIKTRNIIERAFGLLKRRFAILSIPVRTKLSTTKNIIIACAILHNIALTHSLSLGEEIGVIEDPEVGEIERVENSQGAQRRATIVDRYF